MINDQISLTKIQIPMLNTPEGVLNHSGSTLFGLTKSIKLTITLHLQIDQCCTGILLRGVNCPETFSIVDFYSYSIF